MKEQIKGHKLIFKVLVGSHAYGTNVEGSDEDIKGIYIQSPEDVLESGYLEQINVSKDETYYELGRFINLCVAGNPTMLEILFAPIDTILYIDRDYIYPLWLHKDKLLSKQLRWSFGGYAIDQIKKASGLDKKMNWEDERKIRKTVLDFCYVTEVNETLFGEGGYYPGGSFTLNEFLDHYNLKQEQIGLTTLEHFRYTYNMFLDAEDGKLGYKGVVSDKDKANDISLSASVPANEHRIGVLYFNKDGYSVHCKEYASYETWLKERNEQRYIDVEGHGQRIDGKNMLHCTRLLDVATEIALNKELKVRRPNRDYLISIRKGKVSLEELLANSNKKISELDELFNKSGLPDKADKEFWKNLVIELRRKEYKK